MLVLTVIALVVPLTRRKTSEPTRSCKLIVYKNQLAEIKRDIQLDLLTVDQAESIQVEVQRRILQTADFATTHSAVETTPTDVRRLAIIIGVVLPIVAVFLYLGLGAPDLPDRPAAEIITTVQDIERIVDELAQHMETNPDKVEGWILLARSQQQLGRYAAAARSFRMAIEGGVEDFDTIASYGEMVVASRGGQVVPEAREAFVQAYRVEPRDPRATFYLGLAALQEGDSSRAIAIWRELEENAPLEAPWLDTLHNYITTTAKQANLVPSAIIPLPPVSGIISY